GRARRERVARGAGGRCELPDDRGRDGGGLGAAGRDFGVAQAGSGGTRLGIDARRVRRRLLVRSRRMAGRYAARRRNMNGVDSIQIAAAGAPQAWVSGAGLGATLRRPSMIAILWAAALVHVGLTAAELPARAGRFDFSIYYASALALRQNLNPYRINLARIGAPLGLETAPIEHATDPPAFLVCFEPLTLLPVRAAYWVWIALNLAALLAALRLLLGAPSGIDSRLGLALGALALLYPPVGDHFFWAQNKLLVLLLLVLMARWMQQRRDAAAGLTLAVAGLWRGFPFILVGYLVLGRRWRAL